MGSQNRKWNILIFLVFIFKAFIGTDSKIRGILTWLDFIAVFKYSVENFFIVHPHTKKNTYYGQTNTGIVTMLDELNNRGCLVLYTRTSARLGTTPCKILEAKK